MCQTKTFLANFHNTILELAGFFLYVKNTQKLGYHKNVKFLLEILTFVRFVTITIFKRAYKM